jgi:hypothetical protein
MDALHGETWPWFGLLSTEVISIPVGLACETGSLHVCQSPQEEQECWECVWNNDLLWRAERLIPVFLTRKVGHEATWTPLQPRVYVNATKLEANGIGGTPGLHDGALEEQWRAALLPFVLAAEEAYWRTRRAGLRLVVSAPRNTGESVYG